MKEPLTERECAIAQRRAEGQTFGRIGKEFGLTPESVKGICQRVEDYARGAAMLRRDPTSIEALGLVGDVRPSVQQTLRARGIQHLTDLEGFTMDQLLLWPNVGRLSATFLLQALSNLKKTN